MIGTTNPSAKLNVVETKTDTGGSWPAATNINMTASPASASTANFIAGSFSTATGTNQNMAGLYGVIGTASNGGTGSTVTDVQGLRGVASNSASGAATNVSGATLFTDNSSTGTITNAYGLTAAVYKSGGGTVTNGYGVHVGSVAGTNHWSFYAADSTSPSYFAGNVGIGTTSPGAKLAVGRRGRRLSAFNRPMFRERRRWRRPTRAAQGFADAVLVGVY